MNIDQTRASAGITLMNLISHNETPPLSESHETVSHNPSQYKLIASPKHTHQEKQSTVADSNWYGYLLPAHVTWCRHNMFNTTKKENRLRDDFLPLRQYMKNQHGYTFKIDSRWQSVKDKFLSHTHSHFWVLSSWYTVTRWPQKAFLSEDLSILESHQ